MESSDMKRFTGTEKWQKPWFRKLTPRLKCLMIYLWDNCDLAGVIEPDWEVVSLLIGEKVSPCDLDDLGDQVEPLGTDDIDNKYLIPDFIPFQYGTLSQACRPHLPVIACVAKHRLSDRYPIGISMPKEQDKEQDKEKDRGVQGGFPTLEQVKTWAAMENILPDIAEKFWNHYESSGWVDKNGHEIKNARAKLRVWRDNARNDPGAVPEVRKPQVVRWQDAIG